jgi:hypothetical protein
MKASTARRAVAYVVALWISLLPSSCGESAEDRAMRQAREFARLLGTNRSHVLQVLGEPCQVAIVWGLPLPDHLIPEPEEEYTTQQEKEFGDRQVHDILEYAHVQIGVNKLGQVTYVLPKCLLPHLTGMHQCEAVSLMGYPDLVEEADFVWWPGGFTVQEVTQRLQQPVPKILEYPGCKLHTDGEGFIKAVKCNW